MAVFAEIFEKYGFQPLETPTIEFQDILLGKYGEEAEKLMYLFKDQGGRDVGLRYDLTVPTARVVAQYPSIPKPFKRYQIQPAFRAEKPQRGRYREFTQCDIDTFGTTSPLADAEILAVIYECLKAIGFQKFTIRVNSRQVIFKTMEASGVAKDKLLPTIQSLDKLDKKTADEVKSELANRKLSAGTIDKIFNQISTSEPDNNLIEILSFAENLGVPADFLRFDSTLSRGLDYYTGAIFETTVTEPKIGSITGGGRYDELIGQFTGQPMPAVGTTIGLDRVVDVISELNLWPDFQKQSTKVLVTIFSPALTENSLGVLASLRNLQINSEIYLDPAAKLDKQLKYADQKGIPYAVIIGPEEAGKNLVTVKNLGTKEQKTIAAGDLIDEVK